MLPRFLLLAMLLLPAAGRAPVSASAQTFLHRLYAPYVAGAGATSRIDDAAVAAPSLLALIRRDVALAGDEVPTLDWDPVCNCQDYEPLRHLTVVTRPAGRDSVTAVVRFTNGNHPERLTYTLVATRAGWRIADIVTRPAGSLVALLRRANAERAR